MSFFYWRFFQHPEPEERVPLLEDLQGFWDMIKIQIDNVDDMFAEIQHMSQNDWKEVPKQVSNKLYINSFNADKKINTI